MSPEIPLQAGFTVVRILAVSVEWCFLNDELITEPWTFSEYMCVASYVL